MACNLHSAPTRLLPRTLTASLALLIAMAPCATAQTTLVTKPIADPSPEQTRPELPDSPDALVSSSTSSSTRVPGSVTDPYSSAVAPVNSVSGRWAHREIVIEPGDIAEPMTVPRKIVVGLRSSVTLFSATGWVSAAGWEQLTNSSPNYGTDAGAFGQRLGFATVRGISNSVFSKSLFAPLFHEDPRYYVMGPGHPFSKRLVYAATRSIVTRTDSGNKTPNFSLFAGNAAGSALTIPYYPSQNTSFKEVARTFGGSIGGSSIGFVVDEFIIDALADLHIRNK
jgi:hypothetical protein